MNPKRYRKRPVEIEAMRWDTEDSDLDIIEWAEQHDITIERDESTSGAAGPDGEDWGHFAIGTLEGDMLISPTDWVIRGVQGEMYPCKAGIFVATYDEVDQ